MEPIFTSMIGFYRMYEQNGKIARAHIISCFYLFLVDIVLAFLQQEFLRLRFRGFAELSLSHVDVEMTQILQKI